MSALKFQVAFFTWEEGGMHSEWRDEVFDTPEQAAALARQLNRDEFHMDRNWLVVSDVGMAPPDNNEDSTQ